MIVNKDLNSVDSTLKKWMTAIRYLHMAERSAPSSAKNLLPPLPIDSLQSTQLAPTFYPRTVRHLSRIMSNRHITTLREQVYLLSELLERELKFLITGAELSTVFWREGSRAHGMIAGHLHALDSPDPLHPGRPGLADHILEDHVVRFCLQAEQERQPVTFSDVIDYLGEKSVVVDRFWVYQFVSRHRQMLAVQRAQHLEEDRHDVPADDIRVYFESISGQITSIPSAFQKNADETRVGSAKHMSPPDVIVASGTKPGSVPIPEIRDDAQLSWPISFSD
jgi:hypothetical protein